MSAFYPVLRIDMSPSWALLQFRWRAPRIFTDIRNNFTDPGIGISCVKPRFFPTSEVRNLRLTYKSTVCTWPSYPSICYKLLALSEIYREYPPSSLRTCKFGWVIWNPASHRVPCCRHDFVAWILNLMFLGHSVIKKYQTVAYYIHSDRRSCPNKHPPPPSSSSWQAKMDEIGGFWIKKCMDLWWTVVIYWQLFCSLMLILRSDFEPVIMYQIQVLLTSAQCTTIRMNMVYSYHSHLRSTICFLNKISSWLVSK